MHVYPIVRRLVALTAVRLALGVACFGGAFGGAENRPALVAFAFGGAGSAVLLLSDRRARLLGTPAIEPLPENAASAPWAGAILRGLWPSTVGVTVLALVALVANAVLAALLAGVLAGMALAGVLGWTRIAARERREGVTFYGELDGSRIFASDRP